MFLMNVHYGKTTGLYRGQPRAVAFQWEPSRRRTDIARKTCNKPHCSTSFQGAAHILYHSTFRSTHTHPESRHIQYRSTSCTTHILTTAHTSCTTHSYHRAHTSWTTHTWTTSHPTTHRFNCHGLLAQKYQWAECCLRGIRYTGSIPQPGRW